MTDRQQSQTDVSQMPQPSVPGGTPVNSKAGDTAQGNGAPNQQHRDEQSLVKLYMELTAESESQARSVLMFIHHKGEEFNDRPPD